jgi:hypothetical protein
LDRKVLCFQRGCRPQSAQICLSAANSGLPAALLLPPLVPYEPAWEVAGSLGYAACCAMILAFRLGTPPVASWRLRLHRVAGNAAVVLVVAHIAVMLAVDRFLLDYLGWMMPRHVMAGLGAAMALLVATAVREPFFRLPQRYRGGRNLHGWAGLAAGALAGVHALTSSAKLAGFWRWALLAAVFAAVLAPVLESLARRHLARKRGRLADLFGPHRRVGTVAARSGPLLVLLGALGLLLVAIPALLG